MRRILLLLVIVLVAYAAYEWATFPDIEALKSGFPKTTSFMEIRRAELRGEGKDDTLQYTPVPYGQISPYLRRGVLVAEDNSFYEHAGVDTEAMREAFERDWKRKQITHGGSTITQQLAKNLYLSPSRNPLRKIREYFIAMALERHLTKKRILELRIYDGHTLDVLRTYQLDSSNTSLVPSILGIHGYNFFVSLFIAPWTDRSQAQHAIDKVAREAARRITLDMTEQQRRP